MRRVLNRANGLAWVAVLGVVAIAAAPVMAADSDLSTTASGPATVAPGGDGTITVSYANAGPDEAVSAYANLEMPAGVPAPFDMLTQDQVDFIEASLTDDNGNVPLLFAGNSCDALLIQAQGPSDNRPDPLDNLGVGGGGSFSVSTQFPMEQPRSAGLRIDAPANIAGLVTNIGRGSCDDCADIAGTCFGEPLALFENDMVEVMVVDDGSADPTQGCNPLVNDLTGKVALIDRGGCEFGQKVFNAESAGAVGAIINNATQGCSTGTSPDCVIGMAPGAFGLLSTIPAVMVSFNQGSAIHAEIDAGNQVLVTLGGIPSDDAMFQATIFLAEAADTDPNPDNNDSMATTTIDFAGGEAPTAAFDYAPADPEVGEDIQFTDMSTGDPTSWMWDFGDAKGTSTEQNPVYSYDMEGTYDVTLTVTNDFGSDEVSQQVIVTGGVPQLDEAYFVSAAAFAGGAGGAFFQTDVEVHNGGTSEMMYRYVWLPRDTDNSAPAMSDIFTLGAGMSVRSVNVLSDIFGAAEGAIGALAVFTNSMDAIVFSRTYAITSAGETFGQAIPGVYAGNLIMSGEKKRIVFMTQNDDFRSNLGFQNGQNMNMTVTYEAFDAMGNSLGVFTEDLLPWGNTQVNRVLNAFSPIDVAYIDVWTTTPDASFYAYGSILDNLTDDPTTVVPQ